VFFIKVNVLGVEFDHISRDQALKKLKSYLDYNKGHIVVTPNPEIIMKTQSDMNFKEMINDSDLILADGIGVLIGAKILGKKINNRVEGCDLTERLLLSLDSTQKVFLLGGKPGVAEKAAYNLKARNDQLNVCGFSHGYDSIEHLKDLVMNSKPDIVIVGLGSPTQERFMHLYKDHFSEKLMIGVGGALDIYANELPRAPKFIRSIGMEWMFRAIKEPSRIKRFKVFGPFIMNCLRSK
jgi:N-acetylglucosaminyldiphosphoundecaprenol N-acetyl-beta-D-mannosaminyltransferase